MGVMVSRKRGKQNITKNSDNKEEKHFVADLKYPFSEVNIKKNARLLGRQIDINTGRKTPVLHRLKLAKGAYNKIKNSFFKNKKYTIRTKLLIWNAVIRSIMTYGLNV